MKQLRRFTTRGILAPLTLVILLFASSLPASAAPSYNDDYYAPSGSVGTSVRSAVAAARGFFLPDSMNW